MAGRFVGGGISYAGGGGGAIQVDATFQLTDDLDPTKILKFQVSGITTGTTRTITVPDANGTMPLLGLAQTWTAAQTFRAANAIRSEAASTQDAVVIAGRAGGTSSYAATITPPTLSGNITITLPSTTSTLAILGANTFTAAQAIASGTLSASAPGLTISQTWNNAGVTFVGQETDITATASATLSILEQWKVGGTAKAGIVKDGCIFAELGLWKSAARSFNGSNAYGICLQNNSVYFYASDSHVLIPVVIGPAGGAGFGQGLVVADGLCLTSGSANGTPDLFVRRDAADVLAQRNSTNAQKLRVYGTYTDASNYTRVALNTTSTTAEIAAETAGTGADDIDLALTPAGAGKVKMGSHSAIGAETVTGYITIKDSGGTERKLAVVS